MELLEERWQELTARTDYERCERPRAARFRLDTIRSLCARLGDPQDQVPALHVAGSKGKGTTCHLLAEGLRRSGQRVGLYTSPHLSDWRERIRIDGRPAADELLAQAIEQVLAASDGEETFFDLLTAVAFVVFRDAGCTVQVLETGLGGRFDSTNVVRPMAAVVVAIELEHVDVLGDTLAAIAGEKAGIYKEGAQPWCGPGIAAEAMAVLEQAAAAAGGALRDGGRELVPDFAHPLAVVQADHALAVEVLASLPAPFDAAAPLLRDLPAEELRLPGRLEWRELADGRRVLFDLAHTAVSLPPVLAAFREATRDEPAPAVLIALRDDKDPLALADALAALGPRPAAEAWFALPAGDHPRGADPGRIAAPFDARVLESPAFPDDRSAFLVTGSTYLVGALRPATRRLPDA